MTVFYFLVILAFPGPVRPDERAPGPGEWGFHPSAGEVCKVNPPGFVVRLQPGADRYEFVVARDRSFGKIVYRAQNQLPCLCPSRTLPAGKLYWRFRCRLNGVWSGWSTVRSFSISPDALKLPLPGSLEIFRSVPGEHPRLFLRPETVERARAYIAGEGRSAWEALVRRAEELVLDPPPVEEPPRYPKGVRFFDPTWQAMRKANKDRTVRVLGGAFTLGVVGMLGRDERYIAEGKRLLLAAASWQPYGSTGYRYNDEAAVAYASLFARSYTFLYDALSEQERQLCEKVAQLRGREMYLHLCPQHLWRPYRELAGRAWFALGELGLAFFREFPAAQKWLHFALHVLYTCYPVWSGRDGGWHEGLAAWREEMERFVDFAAILRSACDIDPFKKPFVRTTGFFPFYVQVPGTEGGGFGENCENLISRDMVPAMAVLARVTGNPYWQWYVDAHGAGLWIDPMREILMGLPAPPAGKEPTDLPTSRLFRDVGIAVLNSTLLSAKRNVAVIFKASPFGSAGRGYESQNSFLVYGFGKRFLVRSGSGGYRGLRFRRGWLWRTESVNSLTFEGVGQREHDWNAKGTIVDFADTDRVAYVRGEAAQAYKKDLVHRFTRHILLIKGRAVVIWDEVQLTSPRQVAFHLHAPSPFHRTEQWGADTYEVAQGETACVLKFFWDEPPAVGLSDTVDLQPPPPVAVKEWHLKAESAERKRHYDLVTFISLENRRTPDPYGPVPVCRSVPGGKILTFPTGEIWSILMRSGSVLEVDGTKITDKLVVRATDRSTQRTKVELVRSK